MKKQPLVSLIGSLLTITLLVGYVFLWIGQNKNLLAQPEGGNTIEIYPGDSFEAAVENLQPGDTLIVHEGTYDDSGRISITVPGTAENPVVIKGAEGENPPLIMRPDTAAVQNTINIEGATYLTIQGLEITSNGGDGVKMTIDGTAYITLEDLHIHDVDVGINFKDDIHHITVRHNHIHDTGDNGGTGEGMYVGCHDGSCVVSDVVIENNWVHDTLAADQGDGIEIKKGSHSNVVRDNVIYNTKYPCILLYGTEGNPRNVVAGNVMWNCGDSGIQTAADALIQNNIILDSPANGFNSQDHNGVTPQNLEFIHNTIVGGSPCLRLNNWGNQPGMVLANNAIYCENDNFVIANLDGVVVTGNVVVPATSALPSGGYTVGQSTLLDFVDAANKNVYPTAASALIGAADAAYVTAVDFNNTPRAGQADAGAYTWTGTVNPGWPIGEGFKIIIPFGSERHYLPLVIKGN